MVKTLYNKHIPNTEFDANINLIDFPYWEFCEYYLSDLVNFHAYGYIHNDELSSVIAFYQSRNEPAWFYNYNYEIPGDNHMSDVLDAVIDYNEERGRLRFYGKIYSGNRERGPQWSPYNNERYLYVDEYLLPSKTQCYYYNHNVVLFNNKLMPDDIILRCNLLKQEYRTTPVLGGNL
jgi:hypothetical protein